MELIKLLSKQRGVALVQVEKINADVERCTLSEVASSERAAALKVERKSSLAEAHLSDKRADSAKIDRQILDAETDREAASSALDVLKSRQTAAQADLVMIESALAEKITAKYKEEFAAAGDVLDAALTAVGDKIEQLAALAAVAELHGDLQPINHLNIFIENLLAEGLSTFSNCPQPPSWLHYFWLCGAGVPDLENHPMRIAIDSKKSALLDQLRAAGVEVSHG